jgi:2,5-diketo-D-gluconate reductase B
MTEAPSPIPTLPLPGGNGRMPKLGLGTWPLNCAECRRAVESALALGYRHIDTAEMYGNEAEIGAALAASGLPRDSLFVTTKVWHDHLSPPAAIRAACQASLERLRLDAADLYMVHWPSLDMDLHAVLGAMARLQEDGLARAIGVCNFPPGLLQRALASGAPIACVQVEHHVYLSQERLLAQTRPAGIPLVSYSPTAKAQGESDPVLQRIARKHGRTPTEVALAWLLEQDAVAAIPKASSEAHQRSNLEAVSLRLDDDDRAGIAALPKNRRLVNPGFAVGWDT